MQTDIEKDDWSAEHRQDRECLTFLTLYQQSLHGGMAQIQGQGHFIHHLKFSNNCIIFFSGIEKAEVLSTGESEDDHQAKECL